MLVLDARNGSTFLLDLDRIKQQTATMTATRKITPRMQKAIASFDMERHRVPSERNVVTFGGYSSTEMV